MMMAMSTTVVQVRVGTSLSSPPPKSTTTPSIPRHKNLLPPWSSTTAVSLLTVFSNPIVTDDAKAFSIPKEEILSSLNEVEKLGSGVLDYSLPAFKFLLDGLKTTVQVTAPVVKTAGGEAVKLTSPILNNASTQAQQALLKAGIDLTPLTSIAKTVVDAAKGSLGVVKPIASETIESISEKDPATIATSAGALVLAYLLFPPVWSTISFRFRGYKGNLSAAQTLETKYKNNTDKSASIHSSENPVCSKRKVECSDKGSDTQTSCTRQSMEAQSTYLQSAEQNKMNLTGNNSKDVLVLHDDTEAEGKPMGSTAEVSSFNQTNEAHTLGGNSANNEINCPNRISSLRFNDYHQTEGCNLYKMKPSVQVADLLGAMDSKTKRILILENGTNIFDGTMDNPSSVIDDSDQLQLSLKRYQPSSNCIEIESSRCKRLSHSNSSAFSWYSSSKVLQSRNLPNPTCTPRPEATESTMISSSQDRISVQHSYDNALAHFPYSQRPTTIQKSASTNSNHSIPRTNDLDPSEETEKIYENENAELQNLESTEDPKNIPSSTAYCNRSGSVCNGSDDAKGSGIAYEDGMHTKDGNRATKESDNDNIFQSREVILPTRPNRSIEREAALLKFRLKRKERCFGKKVRYHSRQKLAEQRPRVKGQFVRQVQSVETKANING